LAAYFGYTEVAKVFIDAGANLDLQNERGYTALMEAAIYGSTEIAKVLADAGANLRLQGKLGYTASPMRMLNLDFLSEREYTALSIAAHGGFTVITEVLATLC
jgi:ankyrin repeat protein